MILFHPMHGVEHQTFLLQLYLEKLFLMVLFFLLSTTPKFLFLWDQVFFQCLDLMNDWICELQREYNKRVDIWEEELDNATETILKNGNATPVQTL